MQAYQAAYTGQFPCFAPGRVSDILPDTGKCKQGNTGNEYPEPHQGYFSQSNELAQNSRKAPEENGNMKLKVGLFDLFQGSFGIL